MKSLSEDIIGAVLKRYKLIYQVDTDLDKAYLVYLAEDALASDYPSECSFSELEILLGGSKYEKLPYDNDEHKSMELVCVINDYRADLQNVFTMGNRNYNESDHVMFVSKMSHDIRTPMNALLGYVTLAGTKLNQPEILAGYLNKIMVSGKRTIQIVNDVLEFVRLSSGKVEVENKTQDLGKIVNYIKSCIEPQADEKSQTLVIEADITDSSIICDGGRVNQIMMCLLSNAIKYTQPDGEIVFKIFQKKETSLGKVRYEFIIQDNGYGMSEEFQEYMFEPFHREHNTVVNSIEGIGLGLSIARAAVELLDGTIDVSSTIGEGTMIIVTLDFDKGDNGDNNAIIGMMEYKGSGEKDIRYVTDSLMSGKLLEGKRVLVAEDNEINQDIISEILQQLGAIVEVYSNGQETYEAVKSSYRGQFDVILMDVQMPVMDGNEATKRIRELSDDYMSQIPIIGVSANAFAEDRQMAADVGMDGYIAKPIDIAELIGTLQGLI
ncbi:MAG: response regulator [Butyrivibrio sp.]|uniref:response regulator n=1 Tax=Butyrivibrio sp. TaxID=28121 RepID=UPI0025FCEF67|nr:response regulator [Butyrivibrio sp.]MCR5769961.1 response regulator [Butyrivibrio sp.]